MAEVLQHEAFSLDHINTIAQPPCRVNFLYFSRCGMTVPVRLPGRA
jgi:hypothetical protein